MSTNIFTPQRQYNFILRQFSVYQNKWTIAVTAIIGLLLIVSIGTALINPVELNGILGFYHAVFFFGGLILTNQIFSELHSPHKSYSLLTLPASTLEKLLGSWFITSPLYILGFSIISITIYGLSLLVADKGLYFTYYFSADYWQTIASYLIVQTIFLWGACYFRKNNFLKTVIAIFGLFFALALYSGLLGYILFHSGGGNFNFGFETDLDGSFNTSLTSSQTNIQWVVNNLLSPSLEFLVQVILGPYMLLMSYFTLKERQV